MAFLFKRKSKDIDVNGQPVVESAFARRQSMAQKFEQEQGERPRFKTADDIELSKSVIQENGDDDIPPPPPDDDNDAPPPPPPPVVAAAKPAAAAAKPAAAASVKHRSASPPLPPSNNSPLGKKAAESLKDKSAVPSSPGGSSKKPADSDYVEFTVVPLLLRSGVSYDEANKYGEYLKTKTEADVMRIMSSAMLLQDDIEKKKIKIPASFEKTLLNDQFWVKGKNAAGNRKSFVYYSPVETPTSRPSSTDASASSPVAKLRAESTRSRASFSGGPIPVLSEEGDASRYKAATRRDKAESVSKDLQDLVEELAKMDAKGP